MICDRSEKCEVETAGNVSFLYGVVKFRFRDEIILWGLATNMSIDLSIAIDCVPKHLVFVRNNQKVCI